VVSVTLVRGRYRLDTHVLRPGPARFEVRNETDRPGLLLLASMGVEHGGLPPIEFDPFLTGGRVLSQQTFRRLFRSEVIQATEGIGVREVTMLFTDLKGSTALYEKIGDLRAFGLVRQHFERLSEVVQAFDGAVVKTIGDAVMASFRTPADAVAAAFDMHRALAGVVTPEGSAPLVLKAGVHAGPSIVVNSGGALDFFGTTSNLAARAQHESLGGDVVTTDDVLADEDVRHVLASIPHRDEPFRARLKGFEAEVALHRVLPA
jgi:class 3 adenylate cyclase